VFIVILVLLVKGSTSLVGKIVGKMVYEKHRTAEIIVNDGKVPREWLFGYIKIIPNFSDAPFYDEQKALFEKKYKRVLLKKLDRLVDYFKKSAVFENDDTKMFLLNRLEETRIDWQARDLEDLIALSSQLEQDSSLE
jgi:hypothetical protein